MRIPRLILLAHVPARDVGMDGVLVYSWDPKSPALSWLLKPQLPLVYVNQAEQTDVPIVNVDDYGGARTAARHLLDLGHGRVGLIYSAPDPDPDPDIAIDQTPDPSQLPHAVRPRYLGWKDELDKAGVTVRTAAVSLGGRGITIGLTFLVHAFALFALHRGAPNDVARGGAPQKQYRAPALN